MNLRLIVTILVIAAAPVSAQAQMPTPATVTKADAQKVLRIISSDKATSESSRVYRKLKPARNGDEARQGRFACCPRICGLLNGAAYGPCSRNQMNSAVTFYWQIGPYAVTQCDALLSILGGTAVWPVASKAQQESAATRRIAAARRSPIRGGVGGIYENAQLCLKSHSVGIGVAYDKYTNPAHV